MIIKRIKIKNYKKFVDAEFKFYGGVNVLIGENEAGKTSLMEAITDCLFADPSSKSKALSDKIFSWGGKSEPYLELEIEHKLNKLLLVKDFAKKTASLVNLDTKKEVNSFPETQAAVKQMLQISNKEVFESTALMSFAEIAKLASSDDLTYVLQSAVLTQDKVNVQKVLQNLRSEIKDLKVGMDRPSRYPGDLKKTMDELEHVEEDLKDKLEILSKANKATLQGAEVDTQLAKVEERISVLEQLLNNFGQREETEGRLKEVNEQLQAIQKGLTAAEKLSAKSAELKAAYAKVSHYDKEETKQLIIKATGLQQSVSSLKQVSDAQNNEKVVIKPLAKKFPLLSTILIGAISLGLVIAVFIFAETSDLFKLAVILAYIVEMVVVIGRGLVPSVPSTVKESKPAIEEQQEVIKRELAEILLKLKVNSVDELYTQRASVEAIKAQARELDGELRGILGGRTIQALQDEMNKLLVAKRDLEHNQLTPDVKQARLTPEEYLRTRRELDTLYLDRKRMEKQSTTHLVQAQEATVSQEDINRLEEYQTVLRERLNLSQRQLAIKELVLETLSDSVQLTAVSVKDQVEKLISKYLPRLTNGRYKQVRLNNDLSLEVFADEKEDWVAPTSHLSNGTIDQIYFLFRVAFCEVLTKEHGVPFLLDDPFVTFDEKRTEEMRKILLELSKQHQILLFTNSMEYEEWGALIKIV